MNKRRCLGVILAAYVLEEEEKKNRASMLLVDAAEELPRKRRSLWVKDWIEKREKEDFCAKLMRELQCEEPDLYRDCFRMTHDQFEYLLMLVKPLIEKQNTQLRKSIPASDRLALTLRYLSTGEAFNSLRYLFRIPQSTISKIIPEVLDAIYKVLQDEYLKMPTTPEAWKAISDQYNEKWNYPNCVGAGDGKHVVMVAPPNAGSIFYNYKGTDSIILMAIADANYKILYVDVGRNGRCSDGGVFNRCSFALAMETDRLGLPPPTPLPGRTMPMPYVLVADDAFALQPNIMKPYSRRGLHMTERIYNYRLSRGRRVIENVLGIMSARFRVLRKPIALNAYKTKQIALACCVLHNYLLTTNKQQYAPPQSFDRYDSNGELIPGEWRSEPTHEGLLPLELQHPRHRMPGKYRENLLNISSTRTSLSGSTKSFESRE